MGGGGKKEKFYLQIAQRVESSEGAFAYSSQLVVAQIPANQKERKRNMKKNHQSVERMYNEEEEEKSQKYIDIENDQFLHWE